MNTGDLLRSGLPQLQPGMLNMPTQHFMQQQHHPQGQPPQGQPSQMGLLQNNPNPNQSLPMLAGGQPNNPANSQYQLPQLQMQQSNHYGRQQVLMQAQNSQGLNPGRGGGPPLNGLGPNPSLQGMSFPNGIMAPQQAMRRMASQPTPLNQQGGHMGGIPQGMQGLAMQGINGQHLRQPMAPQHPLNNMRVGQQPQHSAMQGHMSPDMPMPMNRPPQMPVNNGIPHVNRTSSTQPSMMNNLGQPSGLTQPHSGGMQPPMHQNAFNGGPMSLVHHQPPQMAGMSPHAGTHSQNHTPANFAPGMPMGNVPPPQNPANRPQQSGDNNMLMNFQNPPMQPNLPQVPRIPQSGTQFPFMPSSTSPNPPGDMSQNVGPGQMSGPGPNPHPGHITTPAQIVDRMSSVGNDNFPTPFTMQQSQSNAPARPPSRQPPSHSAFPIPQPPQHAPHQSPRPADPMNPHMAQRPRSQQGQQRQSPPQAGSSRTPRVSQPPLPNSMIPARIPMQPTGPPAPGPSQQPPAQRPPSAAAPPPPAHPVQIAPRQPQGPPGHGHGPGPGPAPANPGPSAQNQQDGGPPSQPPQPAGPPAQPAQLAAQPRPVASYPSPQYLVGLGQAIRTLLHMSGEMAVLRTSRNLAYWEGFVKRYFTPKANMKFTLWKDNQRQEAKPFEIGTPILPRFFQVTTQSGVKSMSLSLDGARERITGHAAATVECPDAFWTFRYVNGYTVTLKGPLTAHIVVVPDPPAAGQGIPVNPGYGLRIENLIFDALTHEKLINIDAIEGRRMDSSPSASMSFGDIDPRFEEPRVNIERASFSAEPINAFGIPQATMRCLELAESVTQMSDLIQFSSDNRLGPKDALGRYADRLRQQSGQTGDMKSGVGPKPSHQGLPTGSNVLDGVNGGIAPTPPSSIYPGTPGASGSQPGQAPATPQNPPHAELAKQGKGTTPAASQSSGQNLASTPASASTPAAAATPGAQTTPAMASATLKRKATQRTEPGSPAVAAASVEAQPPAAKRATRKRARTGTQGGG